MEERYLRAIPYRIVYSLSDPETNEVRYIGLTADLKIRMAQHLSPQGDSLKDRWIRGLLAKGLKPTATELEICDYYMGRAREAFQIVKHRELGCDLFNKVSLHHMMTANTNFEMNLFLRSYVEEEAYQNGVTVAEIYHSILLKHYKAKGKTEFGFEPKVLECV